MLPAHYLGSPSCRYVTTTSELGVRGHLHLQHHSGERHKIKPLGMNKWTENTRKFWPWWCLWLLELYHEDDGIVGIVDQSTLYVLLYCTSLLYDTGRRFFFKIYQCLQYMKIMSCSHSYQHAISMHTIYYYVCWWPKFFWISTPHGVNWGPYGLELKNIKDLRGTTDFTSTIFDIYIYINKYIYIYMIIYIWLYI